ncbi:MAG TPA: rod shape-determining protein MreD [Bacillota bacterium]|nr:rod shape-determining protein MreD [Bacillota bacterium]
MKHRTVLIFFIAAFLLQSTLVLNFNIAGITPNFILCMTVLFSFLYKGNQGLVFGVIFGLLQDIGFSILIGPSAILYFLIALLMSEIRHYLYRDSILNLFFVSIMGTGLYYVIYWLILMIFKSNYSFIYMIKGLPVLLVFNFIIMVVFYLAVGKRDIRYPRDRYYKRRRLYLD